MKKIMILLLTVAMALSLAACGTTASNESGAPTESSTSQSAPLTESTEQIIADIYAQKKVDLDLSTLPVDLTDEYAVEHDLGLKDGSVIKEASVSEPDITAQAYSLVVARVNDASKTEEIAKEMANGINQSKWVCVTADDMKVMTKGDVIVLFMVDSEFSDTVTSDEIEHAFQTVCGGSLDAVILRSDSVQSR